jgi:hypothetical protein
MRETSNPKSHPLARITLLAAGALALAGCAAGYSLVQPGMGGAGSYYTSDGPYAAPAYSYGYGPDAYGPYGANYGYGSLYGPSFTFGLGLGSVCGWSCGGYYGAWPWYVGAVRHHGGRHHGHHHHDDPVASNPSPRPWLSPDHAPVPPRGATRSLARPSAVPERPMEATGNRRMLDSAAFAPRGEVRMPGPERIPDRPAYPAAPGFAERPMRMAEPHAFARPAAPAPTARHMAPPAARNSQAPASKIR